MFALCECSNLDIITMLRSGSLPSTFRHHFGPHVETIVGELASLSAAGNEAPPSGANANAVEYLSAGRFVE